ncbi:MAG: hypothetical protein HC795_14610 [Coleofasciculaceae cyanobacterium RL_1_1]|nr:hypothetical protein [Coleofasciculaceae cyanobacterium RL_1_1]
MKAKRATIAIGTMEIDVFQLPDGSYRMSQTQVAETIGQSERKRPRISSIKTSEIFTR